MPQSKQSPHHPNRPYHCDSDGMACDCRRYGCLETVASLSALKKQARIWLKSQPDAPKLDPESFTSTQLITAWYEGDEQVCRWVKNAANALGESLYNFLNILNINQIWFYGRSCGFSKSWLAAINRQTGFNPFDHREALKMNATQINFRQLAGTASDGN